MVTAAWLFWIISFGVISTIILSKLPMVLNNQKVRIKVAQQPSLWGYVVNKMNLLSNTVWHLILEAKDLRPPKVLNEQVERMRKVFKVRIKNAEHDPAWLPEVAHISDTHQARTPESLYLSAIKKNPNDKHAYEGLGRLYLEDKNFTEAEEIFKFLIKLDPLRDTYYSNLGFIYYSLKRFDDAINSYEKALQLNSKIPSRWINLALCFEALDAHSKAIKAVMNALTLDHLNLNYLSFLADIYLKIQNSVRAEDVLTQILEIDPTNKTAREKLMKLKI